RLQARDLGMAQILSGQHARPEKYDWSRDRLAPLVERVADRAREAGVVRADLTGVDLILLQVSLTVLAKVTHGRSEMVGRDDLPELYRRYLWIFLDGIRPERGGTATLPVPSLTTQETHLLLGAPPSEEQAGADPAAVIPGSRRGACRLTAGGDRAARPAAGTAGPPARRG